MKTSYLEIIKNWTRGKTKRHQFLVVGFWRQCNVSGFDTSLKWKTRKISLPNLVEHKTQIILLLWCSFSKRNVDCRGRFVSAQSRLKDIFHYLNPHFLFGVLDWRFNTKKNLPNFSLIFYLSMFRNIASWYICIEDKIRVNPSPDLPENKNILPIRAVN